MVNQFGGHWERNDDPPPTIDTMWRGYSKLTAATAGHIVSRKWNTNRRGGIRHE